MPNVDEGRSENIPRRSFLKGTGVAAGAGALGTLAGCLGSSGEDGGGGSNGSGGGSGPITVSYLSAKAAESSQVQQKFKESMTNFQNQHENIQADLQTASYGDIKNKLSSTVGAGNQPSIAEAGTAGLQFYFDGASPSHRQWIEGTEGYPDNWSVTNRQAASFRNEWWSGGAPAGALRGINIVPRLVSKVGVSDPLTEMATWSGVYDVIKKVDDQLDTIAWETSGTANDLEGYWSKARTAYTNGDDPWFRGEPTDPTVLMGNEPRTDGMVKNTIKLAKEFSSPNAASLADEEKPAMLITGRAAMFSHGGAGIDSYTGVKQDAKFGWQDGQGDIMYIPEPKVDPAYGSTIGIPELDGVEGSHGAHISALENSHVIFETNDQKEMDAAWELNTYVQRNKNHQIPINGETGRGIPLYTPMLDTFIKELNPPQTFAQALKTFDELGPQATATGSAWDLKQTDQIRWTDINETISQGLAGQHKLEEVPNIIRQRILETLGKTG
jgi:hypothetical protein